MFRSGAFVELPEAEEGQVEELMGHHLRACRFRITAGESAGCVLGFQRLSEAALQALSAGQWGRLDPVEGGTQFMLGAQEAPPPLRGATPEEPAAVEEPAEEPAGEPVAEEDEAAMEAAPEETGEHALAAGDGEHDEDVWGAEDAEFPDDDPPAKSVQTGWMDERETDRKIVSLAGPRTGEDDAMVWDEEGEEEMEFPPLPPPSDDGLDEPTVLLMRPPGIGPSKKPKGRPVQNFIPPSRPLSDTLPGSLPEELVDAPNPGFFPPPVASPVAPPVASPLPAAPVAPPVQSAATPPDPFDGDLIEGEESGSAASDTAPVIVLPGRSAPLVRFLRRRIRDDRRRIAVLEEKIASLEAELATLRGGYVRG